MNIMDRVLKLMEARDRGEEHVESRIKGALIRLRKQTDWMRKLPDMKRMKHARSNRDSDGA